MPLSGKASPLLVGNEKGLCGRQTYTPILKKLHHVTELSLLRLLPCLSSSACVSHDLKLPEGLLSDSEILRQTVKGQLDLLSE